MAGEEKKGWRDELRAGWVEGRWSVPAGWVMAGYRCLVHLEPFYAPVGWGHETLCPHCVAQGVTAAPWLEAYVRSLKIQGRHRFTYDVEAQDGFCRCGAGREAHA